jgi:hypothetical protein
MLPYVLTSAEVHCVCSGQGDCYLHGRGHVLSVQQLKQQPASSSSSSSSTQQRKKHAAGAAAATAACSGLQQAHDGVSNCHRTKRNACMPQLIARPVTTPSCSAHLQCPVHDMVLTCYITTQNNQSPCCGTHDQASRSRQVDQLHNAPAASVRLISCYLICYKPVT